MKIRPTLPAAATAAVIVPAVLLGATAAAHADSGPAASATAPPAASPEVTPTTAPSSPSTTATGPATTPSASAPATPASGGGSLPSCTSAPSSAIRFTLRGLPSGIAPGDGWHTFTLTVAGTGDQALGAIDAAVSVRNGEDSQNDDLYDDAYLEYWDPTATATGGTWLSLKDEGRDDIRETGLIYGSTTLRSAHASADLRFRIRLTAGATPGPAWADGGGTYVDTAKNCTRGSSTEAGFQVLAAGAQGGSGGTTAPASSAGSSSSGAGATPDGGTSDGTAPGGGTLAETGTSSATPVIAAVGGAAVLAGAVAVGVVRRRGTRSRS